MIKKLIGIVAALAVVAAIVFAVLHRGAYTSMLPESDGDVENVLTVPDPAVSSDTLPTPQELPQRDITRMEEEVPDTLRGIVRSVE